MWEGASEKLCSMPEEAGENSWMAAAAAAAEDS